MELDNIKRDTNTLSILKKITRVLSLFTFTLVFLFLFKINPIFAATRTWDAGGGANTNWSECTNWSDNTCPTSSDIATFDGTNTGNSTISASTSVLGIDMNSGYTGTTTMAGGITLTVGTSNLDIAAGNFEGSNSSTIDISGSLIMSAGKLIAPATTTIERSLSFTGGTFTHNSGVVTFDGSYAGNTSITASGFSFNRNCNNRF